MLPSQAAVCDSFRLGTAGTGMGCCCVTPDGTHDAEGGNKENSLLPAKTSPDLHFKPVLADELATQEFLKFTKAEFSSENLDFYLAVRAFKERWCKTEGNPSHAVDEGERRREADGIIEEFLREGTDRQICVGAAARRVFEEASATNSSTMFDAPLRHVS